MFTLYFFGYLSKHQHFSHFAHSHKWSELKKLLFTTLLGVITALLQSAGSLIPFVGLLISPFTTFPIIMSVVISLRYGMLTYILGILLLFLLEPTELLIYPFTTGLLGIGIGVCLRYMTSRILIMIINGCLLCGGICLPLYILGLPVLGPFLQTINIGAIIILWFFSVSYSWLWIGMATYLLTKVERNLIFYSKK